MRHHLERGRPLYREPERAGRMGRCIMWFVVGIDSAKDTIYVNDPAQQKMLRIFAKGIRSLNGAPPSIGRCLPCRETPVDFLSESFLPAPSLVCASEARGIGTAAERKSTGVSRHGKQRPMLGGAPFRLESLSRNPQHLLLRRVVHVNCILRRVDSHHNHIMQRPMRPLSFRLTISGRPRSDDASVRPNRPTNANVR